MELDNVRKCLNIARGMSTAGIDYANIVYSKFRKYFTFFKDVSKWYCKPVLQDLVDGQRLMVFCYK